MIEYRRIAFYGEKKIRDQVDFSCSLYETLSEIILHGVQEFLFFKNDEFDRLSAKVARNLKRKYPDISSVLVMTPSPHMISTSSYDKVLVLSDEQSKEEVVAKGVDAVITDIRNPYESTIPFFLYAKEKQFFFCG